MTAIVHDPEYIAWVKRSLNRLILAGIKTDGVVTDLYREWVKEFQAQAIIPVHGKVDKVTQNAMVWRNHDSFYLGSQYYIKWIQTALKSIGMQLPLTPTGVMDKNTKEAVKKFQSDMSHKNVDGIVGPRTERDLARCAPELTIPGFYPGGVITPDPVKQAEDDWLKNNTKDPRTIDQLMESWIKIMIREIAEGESGIMGNDMRRIIDGMLKKFLREIHTYQKSDSFWYLDKQTVQDLALSKKTGMPMDHAKSALAEIRSELDRFRSSGSSAARYDSFKETVKAMYFTIDDGLRQIWYQIGNNSGVDEGPFKLLKYWHEDGFARKDSIISLFPSPEANIWSPF